MMPPPLMPLVMKESMTPIESDAAVGQEPLRGSVDRKRRTGQARPLRRDSCGHSQGPGRELVKGVP